MTDEKQAQLDALKRLREPFPLNQISKLPKPTRAQTDAVKKDFTSGIRCKICGGWHHKNVVHLDYVGHAALTDRMLDIDPLWNWEPIAVTDDGSPKFDSSGGMWIYLTIAGMTRRGYGDATGKKGGDAIKEVIGDALRNAAMRFGCALDLWHKGELHTEESQPQRQVQQQKTSADFEELIDQATNYNQMTEIYRRNSVEIMKMPQEEQRKLTRYCSQLKAVFEEQQQAPATNADQEKTLKIKI